MILWQIILGYAGLSIQNKINFSLFVHGNMVDNAFFPSPPINMDDFLKVINELQALVTASLDGSKDDTQAMYAKERELHVLMKVLGNYVENQALLDNENGGTIITSAGFGIRGLGGKDKQQFGVERTGVTGQVKVTAEVLGPKVSYTYMYSTDGVEYSIAGNSTRSEFTIDGLTPGTPYHFKVESTIDGVPQPTQGPIVLFVV